MRAKEAKILAEAARLFTNLGDDSTPEEKRNAYREELRLLEELETINPELAEECGIKYTRQLVDKIDS
jgi:hypothetical protein